MRSVWGVGGISGGGGTDTCDVLNVRGILVVTGAMTCLFALVLVLHDSNLGLAMGTESHECGGGRERKILGGERIRWWNEAKRLRPHCGDALSAVVT